MENQEVKTSSFFNEVGFKNLEERPLILIPAKMCSKRLPGKNIKDLCGKPMMQYVLEAALNSRIDDVNITIATESMDMINYFRKIDIFKDVYAYRLYEEFAEDPEKNAYDVALVYLNYIKHLESSCNLLPDTVPKFTTLILLQPDCPFTNSEDIENAYRLFLNKNRIAVLSMTRLQKCKGPYFVETLGFVNNTVYRDNGAIFVCDVAEFLQSKQKKLPVINNYEMPSERSFEVDNELDFMIVECLMKNKLGKEV